MRKDIAEYLRRFTGEEKNLLNKAELGRRFNCDPRTIDRYLKIQSGEIEQKQRKRVYTSKLDGYKEIITNKVDVYGCSAMAAYKFIQKKGYDGKYSLVADFVSKHKDSEVKKATIRFETNPGLQGQVDWKEDMTLVNRHGEVFKINIFLMVLGYSRYKFIKLTSDRNQKTLFQCMIEAFGYFGGIPQELLFDNMKTVVDHAKTTFTRTVFNDTLNYFAKDAGFEPIACRPYRPQTKGKAESLAKLMNRLKAYNEEFETWDDLENIVNEFLEDINNEKSQGIDEIPVERFKKEKEYLLPLPSMDCLLTYIFDQKEYKVSRESMVKYKGKKYSVPTKYIGLKMTIEETDNGTISIYYNGNCVISHQLSEKMYNYTTGTACEILKSDAMKHCTNEEILAYVENNLLNLDKCLGGI